MKKLTFALALMFVIAVFIFSYAEGQAFPLVPELSKFALHMSCLPKDAKNLNLVADIYQLSAEEDIYAQLFVYIIKIAKKNLEIRAEIAKTVFGQERRAFIRDRNEWKNISAEEFKNIFSENMRDYIDTEGVFDPTKFPCRPAEKSQLPPEADAWAVFLFFDKIIFICYHAINTKFNYV